MEEGFRHAIISEIQLLKRNDVVFHYTRLFKLGQMFQMMCIYVKVFIKVYNKLGPRNITSVWIVMPFTPLLMFRIQIMDTNTKFYQVICDAMQLWEIMFHLSDQAYGVWGIKFIHLNFGKKQVMSKGVIMKGHGMTWLNSLLVWMLFIGDRTLGLANRCCQVFYIFRKGV